MIFDEYFFEDCSIKAEFEANLSLLNLSRHFFIRLLLDLTHGILQRGPAVSTSRLWRKSSICPLTSHFIKWRVFLFHKRCVVTLQTTSCLLISLKSLSLFRFFCDFFVLFLESSITIASTMTEFTVVNSLTTITAFVL